MPHTTNIRKKRTFARLCFSLRERIAVRKMAVDGGQQGAEAVRPVGREHQRRLLQRGRQAVPAGDTPAGLVQDQHSGGIVPGLQPNLKKEFDDAGGQQAEFEGRGSPAADVVALHIDVIDDVRTGLGVLLAIEAERRAQDPVGEGPAGHVDGMAVAPRALAQFGGIQFAAPRAVHDPQLQPSLARQRHGDAAVRNAAGIVRGTVDGVDDPHVLLVQVAEILLLAEEAAARQQGGEPFREEMLDGEVRRGDEVHAPVLLHHGEMVRGHQRGRLLHDIDNFLQHSIQICTAKIRRKMLSLYFRQSGHCCIRKP